MPQVNPAPHDSKRLRRPLGLIAMLAALPAAALAVPPASAGAQPLQAVGAVKASTSARASASVKASTSAKASASVSASTSTKPSASVQASASGSANCASAVVCDGFETQTSTAPGGVWSVQYPDCSGSGKAVIDTAVAHSGTTSLRIDGGSGYCNHVFVRASADLSTMTSVYVRFWIRHTTALPTAHVSFLSMPDAADGNRTLRMGGQNGALQFNRESDDATLPAQSPVGVSRSAPLPTSSWQCVEFGVNRSDGTLLTWLNGEPVAGLTEDGVPTADIDQQWLARRWRPALTALRLGWESYGGGTDTLWFDDVVVGAGRAGC